MKEKKIFGVLCLILVLSAVVAIKLLPSNDYMHMSFSEKINRGYTANITVIGDSIGGIVDSGEWCTILEELIEDKYSNAITVTNISKPGNRTFAGIVSWEMLDNTQKEMSDLVILCYGENDLADESFDITYEAMIRNIIRDNPNTEILAILQSSQKEYTDKIRTIIRICEHYCIPYVDTIVAFKDSGFSYDELSDDGVHPKPPCPHTWHHHK